VSQRILTCPKCDSRDIDDLNPEVKDSKKITVKVKAKCKDCGHEFEYTSRTNPGTHNMHILY